MANPLIPDINKFQPPKPGQLAAELHKLGGIGSAIAPNVGLPAGIGQATAKQSLGFGMSFQEAGGGDRFRAALMDQELRLAAAKSPLANAMGAAMAMHEAGIITGDKNTILNQVAQAGPAGFTQLMHDKYKVGMGTASQFLNSQRANQDQIQKNHLQDVVRQFQNAEVSEIMQTQLADNLQSGLSEMGVHNRGKRRAMGGQIAQAMEQELRKMSPKELGDVGMRTKRLAGLVARDFGMNEQAARQLVGGAMQGLDENIRATTGFSNVQEMIMANNPKILEKGAAHEAEITKAAEEARKDKAVNDVKKTENAGSLVDKLLNYIGVGSGGGAGAGGEGGKGPLRIVGNLVLKQDGVAALDATDQGAATA